MTSDIFPSSPDSLCSCGHPYIEHHESMIGSGGRKGCKKEDCNCLAFGMDEYHYSVAWSDEDHAYIARVMEFPSLAAHGKTSPAALKELRRVVAAVVRDLTRG